MSDYRVYKSGEDQAVRTSALQQADTGNGRRTQVLIGAIALVLLAAIVAAVWYFGRSLASDLSAAVELIRLSDKAPRWAMYAAPAVIGAVALGALAYITFGAHVAVKVVLGLLVAVVLAAPGVALGWANGTVSTVGARSTEVKEIVVSTEKQLRPALPGKPVNILLIGRDRSDGADRGRSDTQLLVRLDPGTKSISMLSVPRDLRVMIPGHGLDKMNTAYSYGGPPLVVKTFQQVTGLEINHFIEIDFAGFWRSISILGGVYIPVDRRYRNLTDSSYKKLDIEPGYRLLDSRDSLDFVRFRHDESGDFGRMARQQLFLRELQRQSGRWSSDWRRVASLIKAITRVTTSDIKSLSRLKPLVELVFQVDTSRVYAVHLEGSTPMINGISYVEASPQQVQSAVQQFMHPTKAPTAARTRITKDMFRVQISNASGINGNTAGAIRGLRSLGYRVTTGVDAPEFPGSGTVIYAPRSLAESVYDLAALFPNAKTQLVDRQLGSYDGVRIFVGSSFKGLDMPTRKAEASQPKQPLKKRANYDVAGWRRIKKKTKLKLERPTSWSPGMVYDEFSAYALPATDGKRTSAVVAIVRTPRGGYWSIQALRWLNPPAIAKPTNRVKRGGIEYLYFYEGAHIHMIAWKRNKVLYWVLNTRNNELSNEFMNGIASSFVPVK